MRVRFDMNQRELERLEKNSIYTMRVNSDLKDQVINGKTNELSKFIKLNVKRGKIIVFVIKEI